MYSDSLGRDPIDTLVPTWNLSELSIPYVKTVMQIPAAGDPRVKAKECRRTFPLSACTTSAQPYGRDFIPSMTGIIVRYGQRERVADQALCTLQTTSSGCNGEVWILIPVAE